ncbi:MAG: hypothetical protein WA112_09010 [Rugosibacter sp.]|jgi:hypothetical protein
MSTLELFLLLVLTPVLFIASAYLLAKNRRKIPRTSSFIAGLFFATIGAFFLFYTFDLFSQDQAILPLKMAAPFTKAAHPILFLFCTILNPVIGLAFLGGGVRAIFGSISKKHTEVKNNAHS